MKALVKAKAEPGLWMHDVPEPTPGDGEVLIRVRKTSICGTDLHIHHWGRVGAGHDPRADGGGSRVHG